MQRNADATIDWLLQPEHPAVRHATLTTLLGRLADEREVQEARLAMMRSQPIRTILARQKEAGYWDRPDGFYNRKYRGTAWQVIFLAQLGADGSDPRIRSACEFLFCRSQNAATGGFAISSGRGRSGGGQECLACLTGNLIRSMLHFGYADDERWQHAVQWLLTNQQSDGGWGHGGHSCFQGSIKPLLALTAIPPKHRTGVVSKAIDRAAAFFLQHRLFRRDHHEFDVAKSSHLQLRFPLGWQTDVLELLEGVTAAGVTDDPRIADALAVILAKRSPNGRWLLDDTFRASGTASMWCSIEPKGKPSKWITLRALRVIKRIGQRKAERLAAEGMPVGRWSARNH